MDSNTGQALGTDASPYWGLTLDWPKSMEKTSWRLVLTPGGGFQVDGDPINIFHHGVCWGEPHAAQGRTLHTFFLFRLWGKRWAGLGGLSWNRSWGIPDEKLW